MNRGVQIKAVKTLTETACQYRQQKLCNYSEKIFLSSSNYLCSDNLHNLTDPLLNLMGKKTTVALAESPGFCLKERQAQPVCLLFTPKALCLQTSAAVPWASGSVSAQPRDRDVRFQACVTGMSLVPEPGGGSGRCGWIFSVGVSTEAPRFPQP